MIIKAEINMPKSKSFIALFDILGFKDLIRNDELEDVYKVFLRVSNLINDTKEMAGHLQALLETKVVTVLNYSDTFLIYSLDINDIKENRIDKAFHAILAACDSLFIAANENRLPIRGSITVGDIIVSGDVVMGKPIVEAYEMERQQEWIGCRISREALECISNKAIDEHTKDLAIIEYEIPCKSGNVERMLAYNWTGSRPFREGNFSILNKRGRIDWTVERKHRNTWEFIKYLKSIAPSA